MILFVFEGAEREPRVFRTLERLFFGQGERIVCSFGNNIYELYRQLQEFDGDGDIVSILPDAGHHKPGKREYARVKQNWIWLVQQHTVKANYMCTGVAERPVDKDTVAQPRIFEAQCEKYLCDGERIAVLNGFPLFLFDYFKELK